MLVEFIVVTYHSSTEAARELRRLIECVGRSPSVGLAIVDNSKNSVDADWLEASGSLSQLTRIIRRPDNPGFAKGCNVAAMSSPAEWIVFLNPDILLADDSVGRIVEALGSAGADTAAVAISQVTNSMLHEGVTFTRSGWFLDRVIRGGSSRARVSRALSGANLLFGPSGGAGAFRKAAFARQGGFCEQLFAWGEDADLALRLYLANEKVVGLGLGLEHQGGHSISSDELKSFRARLLARNRVVIAARLYSVPQTIAFGAFFALVLVAKFPAMVSAGTLTANITGIREGARLWRTARSHYQGPRCRLAASWRRS